MTIYNSQYKNLVVSGCSFTHNNHETPCTWGNSLAAWAGMDIANLAMPGAGNSHIKNSVILHLEHNKPDPADTLIIVMWSGVERIDWITDKENSKFKDQYPFSYYYDDYNESVVGGSWWATKPKTLLDHALLDYSKFQSDTSLALNSWLAMQDLENYLRCRGYCYYFTAYLDIFSDSKHNNRWIKFNDELSKLNLTLNKDSWIFDFDRSDWYLGPYAEQLNMLYDDGFHPSWQGHEAWAKDILIPKLIQDNIITV